MTSSPSGTTAPSPPRPKTGSYRSTGPYLFHHRLHQAAHDRQTRLSILVVFHPFSVALEIPQRTRHHAPDTCLRLPLFRLAVAFLPRSQCLDHLLHFPPPRPRY